MGLSSFWSVSSLFESITAKQSFCQSLRLLGEISNDVETARYGTVLSSSPGSLFASGGMVKLLLTKEEAARYRRARRRLRDLCVCTKGGTSRREDLANFY